jgi:hypothetical protein
MATEVTVTPSIEARALFNKMVVMADDNLILPLSATMALYVERMHDGKRPQAEAEIQELMATGWIGAHECGGWTLYEGIAL